MLYAQVIRQQVIDENPGVKHTSIMSLQSKKWKTLDEAGRAPYMRKAADAKAAYQESHAAYEQTEGFKEWSARKQEYIMKMKKQRAKLQGKSAPSKSRSRVRSRAKITGKKRSRSRSRSTAKDAPSIKRPKTSSEPADAAKSAV